MVVHPRQFTRFQEGYSLPLPFHADRVPLVQCLFSARNPSAIFSRIVSININPINLRILCSELFHMPEIAGFHILPKSVKANPLTSYTSPPVIRVRRVLLSATSIFYAAINPKQPTPRHPVPSQSRSHKLFVKAPAGLRLTAPQRTSIYHLFSAAIAYAQPLPCITGPLTDTANRDQATEPLPTNIFHVRYQKWIPAWQKVSTSDAKLLMA